jgi:hypothetical protein
MLTPNEEDILKRFRAALGNDLLPGRPAAVVQVLKTSEYWTVPRCRAVACILAVSPFQSHQDEALEILDGIELYQRARKSHADKI